MTKKTLAIVGCGKLAQITVNALINGLLPNYQLIGTYSRTFEKAEDFAQQIRSAKTGYDCTACETIKDLLGLEPDYIIEAASPLALREFAIPALQSGCSLVTLSIGALADTKFYEQVKVAAQTNNTRVHLVPGAVGGFDILRTVALMGAATATFDTEKGPNSLKNTEVYDEALQTEKKTVFEGNAVDAIGYFPTKVNAAVAASLASVGPDAIKVSVTSVPDFVGNRHRIQINSEQVDAVIEVHNKTSQIAGWSVVSTLQNITSPIAF